MVNNLKSFEMPISQTDEWCIRKELRKSLCITIIAPTKTRLHSTATTIKCSNHNLTFWMFKCRTTGKQQNIEYWNDFVDLRCAFYSYTKYHIYSAPFFSLLLSCRAFQRSAQSTHLEFLICSDCGRYYIDCIEMSDKSLFTCLDIDIHLSYANSS